MNAKSASQILVPGLQKLDTLELSQKFPEGSLSFADEEMPDGKHGELATTAVIVLTALSIKALAAWLLKSRTKNRITRTIEVVEANGTKRIETIDMDLSSSLAPKADVMQRLSELTSFDLTKLIDDD